MSSKVLKAYLSIIILSLFSSYIQPQSIDSLAGNWLLVKNARQWDVDLRFDRDYKFYVQRHLSASYSYALNGDTLISYLQNTYPDSETVVDTSYITVKKDTIVRTYMKSGQKNSIYMIRDKSYQGREEDADNPLIGQWKWTYPSKDTALEIFHNDHAWDFSVSGKMNTGHFEVNKDTLIMIYNDKKGTKREHTFWLEKNLLGIKDLKTNKEYLYKRAKE